MIKKSLVASPVREGVIAVDEWVPEKDDIVITYKGKAMFVAFDKYIEGLHTDALNTFYVSYKDSYVKRFDKISLYINYFIKFYDPDDELILNYFHCKYIIDAAGTNPTRKAMIKLIYKNFVTDSMYEKVKKFVDDNYRVDLAQNKEAGKEYSESLEFTNDHAKILMVISTFIKFIIPLVMHYISVVKGKPEVKKLIEYYKPLFTLTYKKEGVNLFAKLFHTILVKVKFNEQNNSAIWAKYEANSMDAVSYAEDLLKKNLIVDNVFKYNFQHSIISFNSVILKTQLEYCCIKNFGINMQEISTEKDNDGLSYLDKLEMDMSKIDENAILLNKVNIKDTIKRIRHKFRIDISKDEKEFYMEHTDVNKISKTLVFYYYAKIFGGFTPLNHITLKRYMELMILMKRKLESDGYIYIPQLISGNIVGKAINRMGHNSKQLSRIESTPIFQNLVNEKYPSFNIPEENIKDKKNRRSPIMQQLDRIRSNQFSYVDYDDPENLGKKIRFDYDILDQEYESFINSI